MNHVVQFPDLTELGELNRLPTDVAAWKSPTQWAFATTIRTQKGAMKALKESGWTLFGQRKNRSTGVHIIDLWVKEFPKAVKPAESPEWHEVRSIYCCGLVVRPWLEGYLETNWLAIMRTKKGQEMPKQWRLIGESAIGGAIWTTAEPGLLARLKARKASNRSQKAEPAASAA